MFEKKKTVVWLISAIAILVLMLGVYGLSSWFFPSDRVITVVSFPAIVIGILCAFWLCRNLDPERYQGKKIRKHILCAWAFTFIPIVCWVSLVIGAPAFITSFLPPNTVERTKIITKSEGGIRTCRYEVGLEGLEVMFKDRICLNHNAWKYFLVNDAVTVSVRKDMFGTRIYEINRIPTDIYGAPVKNKLSGRTHR